MSDTGQDKAAIRNGWIAFTLWAAIFAGAFVAFGLTAPRDFGFTAGANRVVAFLGWQTAAGALAMLCAVLRRHVPRGRTLRWLLLVPPGIFLALLLCVTALLFYAGNQQPAPAMPPATSTQ